MVYSRWRAFISKVLAVAIVAMSAAVHAGPPKEDLKYLRKALTDASFPEDRLVEFLNPWTGHQNFRLDAINAPWAGNYFPMQKGGLATRWSEDAQKEALPAPAEWTEPQVWESREAVRYLSPIEKYDLLMGRYDFPSTKHELEKRGPQRKTPVQDWEGFCNGVRCAGILLPEPRYPIEVVNPQGLTVTFEPADLKALAGASFFFVEKYAQIGSPKREGQPGDRPDPAVFDLALRYYLAEMNRSFVVDSNLGPEVWNESVVGYQRQVGAPESLSESEKARHPWAASKVSVRAKIETLGEVQIDQTNQATKHRVASGELVKPILAYYWLYLNEKGEARSGEWTTGFNLTDIYGAAMGDRERGIDFAWFGEGEGTDSQYRDKGGNKFLKFDVIKDLVRRSQVPHCGRLF